MLLCNLGISIGTRASHQGVKIFGCYILGIYFWVLCSFVDSLREGVHVNRPPLLDEKNYGYWHVRISSCICSVDEKAWSAMLDGWTKPTGIAASGMNQKVMNAIFFH